MKTTISLLLVYLPELNGEDMTMVYLFLYSIVLFPLILRQTMKIIGLDFNLYNIYWDILFQLDYAVI